MGEAVSIVDAGMRFGDFWALRHIDVEIRAGEFFSFLGPSGCGKTTLLRLISGFMEPTEGVIRIGGKDMKGIGPNRRPTAMIFQNPVLFPLMSVADNIAFGLEVRRVPRAERIQRAEALLELVDLPAAGGKAVEDLSGGQKQRVAIARALAVEPAVLMLDEPLSALDLKLRQHMRVELRNIKRRTGVTFIYITHDQGEALTMSDPIAVMSEGRIEQLGAPDAVYNTPKTPFVAAFVGETNRFRGRVVETKGAIAVLETRSGAIRCRNPEGLSPGADCVAFVRPEAMSVSADACAANGDNCLACRIVSLRLEGACLSVRLQAAAAQTVTMRLSNDGTGFEFAADRNVYIRFGADQALLLPEGEAAGA